MELDNDALCERVQVGGEWNKAFFRLYLRIVPREIPPFWDAPASFRLLNKRR